MLEYLFKSFIDSWEFNVRNCLIREETLFEFLNGVIYLCKSYLLHVRFLYKFSLTTQSPGGLVT